MDFVRDSSWIVLVIAVVVTIVRRPHRPAADLRRLPADGVGYGTGVIAALGEDNAWGKLFACQFCLAP